MKFELGDVVLWSATSEDPNGVRSGRITKMGKPGSEQLIWVDGRHKPEDCIYAAFCWPERVKDEYLRILMERKRLKKEYDDSMKLIYELRNRLVRGEI